MRHQEHHEQPWATCLHHSHLNAQKPNGRISTVRSLFCFSREDVGRRLLDLYLRACLFEGGDVELAPLLRSEAPDDVLRAAFETCVRSKPEVHGARGAWAMSRMGG